MPIGHSNTCKLRKLALKHMKQQQLESGSVVLRSQIAIKTRVKIHEDEKNATEILKTSSLKTPKCVQIRKNDQLEHQVNPALRWIMYTQFQKPNSYKQQDLNRQLDKLNMTNSILKLWKCILTHAIHKLFFSPQVINTMMAEKLNGLKPHLDETNKLDIDYGLSISCKLNIKNFVFLRHKHATIPERS